MGWALSQGHLHQKSSSWTPVKAASEELMAKRRTANSSLQQRMVRSISPNWKWLTWWWPSILSSPPQTRAHTLGSNVTTRPPLVFLKRARPTITCYRIVRGQCGWPRQFSGLTSPMTTSRGATMTSPSTSAGPICHIMTGRGQTTGWHTILSTLSPHVYTTFVIRTSPSVADRALSSLLRRAVNRQEKARAPGTTANHRAAVSVYIAFMGTFECNPLDPTTEMICAYLEYTAEHNPAPTTIRNKMSHIPTYLRLVGHST